MRAKEFIEGDQGRFAGDTAFNLGGAIVNKIKAGDVVSYFGDKAKVLDLDYAKNYARIDTNLKTLNVKLSDLKRVGRGVAEGLNEDAVRAEAQADYMQGQCMILAIAINQLDPKRYPIGYIWEYNISPGAPDIQLDDDEWDDLSPAEQEEISKDISRHSVVHAYVRDQETSEYIDARGRHRDLPNLWGRMGQTRFEEFPGTVRELINITAHGDWDEVGEQVSFKRGRPAFDSLAGPAGVKRAQEYAVKYLGVEGGKNKTPGTDQQGVAEGWDDEDEVDKITLVKSLQWPELVNKVNSAMKAMGWKGQRKDDGSFMFSTRGQLDDEWYIVVIDNRGNNVFTYALGTVEEGDPHIGEQESLPMTEASVSELMMAIREGFGLDESSMAEGLTTEKQLLTRIRQIMYDRKLSGTESNAGELLRLKQQLKDVRSQQQMADSLELEFEAITEDLRKWFKQKWVRFGPDGKIRGDCARGSEKEGKPKCLPKSKAQSLGKKGRAAAAGRKRRQDPDANRSGKAINVKTK